MLQQAYVDTAVKRSQVHDWHKSFQYGRKSVDDDPSSCGPSMPKNKPSVERVREFVRSDRRNFVYEIAPEVGISEGSFHSILHDVLIVSTFCHHLLPRMLTPEQKETGMNILGDLINMIKTTHSLTTSSQGKEHDASCTIHKQNGNLNVKHHRHL